MIPDPPRSTVAIARAELQGAVTQVAQSFMDGGSTRHPAETRLNNAIDALIAAAQAEGRQQEANEAAIERAQIGKRQGDPKHGQDGVQLISTGMADGVANLDSSESAPQPPPISAPDRSALLTEIDWPFLHHVMALIITHVAASPTYDKYDVGAKSQRIINLRHVANVLLRLQPVADLPPRQEPG